MSQSYCSTPEGVIVSIALGRGGDDRTTRLLNARGRHRLDRDELDELASPVSAAQRPRASSSRSPPGPGTGPACSTTAQRPRASSSRSLADDGPRPLFDRPCSTPEGVIVSIASVVESPCLSWINCSTPEGVIVSIARRTSTSWRPSAAAQRPRASSSRSPSPHSPAAPGVMYCSTPEGVIVSIAPPRPPGSAAPRPAQRPRASSSRSPAGPRWPTTNWSSAQRPRASSSRSRRSPRRSLEPL